MSQWLTLWTSAPIWHDVMLQKFNIKEDRFSEYYIVYFINISMSKLKNSGQNPCKCRARANKLNLIQRLVLSVTQLQCAAAAALLKPALVTMKKLNFKFESLISQDVQNQFWYKCLMGYKVKWRFKTLSFCKTLLNNVVGSMWRYAMQWTEFLWNFNDFLPTCFIWTVLFIFPCLGMRSVYDLR